MPCLAETLRFGYDGDGGLGDRLLSAVLRGEKTATSSLAVEYLSGESLPRVGQRLTLVDHAGVPAWDRRSGEGGTVRALVLDHVEAFNT